MSARGPACSASRFAVALFATGLCLTPPLAVADPATEAALQALVASIDASPDWIASFTGVSSDATGAAMLTGLKVESTLPGMTIAIDRLSVTRGSATSDGRYAAARVTAGKIAISAGPVTVTLDNASLDDFAAPPGLAFAFDPAKPASSLLHAYGALAKTRIGQARAGTVAITERLAHSTSRVSYENVNLTRLNSGRIATLSAGPLLSETPIPDQVNPKPLVTVSVSGAESRDIDLAALLRIYDASPAAGARTWTPAIAASTYRDATITAAGVTIKLGTVSLDDLKVRPGESSLANDLDRSIAEPFEDGTSGDPAGLLNLLSAYSVGKFSAGPIDVSAVGIDNIHLDGLSIANLSLDGLGELALSGLSAGVHDVASLQAGRIAIGRLAFPKSDVLAAGLRTAFAGGDVDFSTITPAVGFIEFGALDLNVTGFPSTHLAKARVDLANHVGTVPTSFKVDVAGADLDAVLMPGSLRQQLTRFGYTRIKADLAAQIAWDEAKKTTSVSGLRLSVKDAGTVTADAILAGVARTDIEQLNSLAALQSFAPKLSLVSGKLSFKDESIVGRVIADQAAALKVDAEKFRDQFVRGLPFMLLPVGTPDFQRKAAPVFQEFMRAPGMVTFTAAPAMPVPFPTLINAATSSGVFTLPTLLNLSVVGVPGPRPPAPPPPPQAPPAPAVPPPAPGASDFRGTSPAPN